MVDGLFQGKPKRGGWGNGISGGIEKRVCGNSRAIPE